MVVNTAPHSIVWIEPETEIELLPEYTEPKETRRADVLNVIREDVGGLQETREQL